jgi:hypothetical protein
MKQECSLLTHNSQPPNLERLRASDIKHVVITSKLALNSSYVISTEVKILEQLYNLLTDAYKMQGWKFEDWKMAGKKK